MVTVPKTIVVHDCFIQADPERAIDPVAPHHKFLEALRKLGVKDVGYVNLAFRDDGTITIAGRKPEVTP